MIEGTDRKWISFREGRAILAIGYTAFQSLVNSGRLTVRRVPGSTPRVLRSEVEDLANACTTSRAS